MRGLEEIRESNENPSAYYASREPQHGVVDKAARSEAQRFHGERVEARQRERTAWDGTSSHARVQNSEHKTKTGAILEGILADIVGGRPKEAAKDTAEIMIELAATAAVLDGLRIPRPDDYDDAEKLIKTIARVVGAKPETAVGILEKFLADKAAQKTKVEPKHLGQEGILSAIDGEPPFLKFWAKLNDERAEQGLDEAGYGEAKKAFFGGPTPEGALTFIGKQWDGLRAIPARAVDGHKTYHGEFRQVSDEGTIWRTVHNGHGPIAYASPEAALNGARHAKAHSEARKS